MAKTRIGQAVSEYIILFITVIAVLIGLKAVFQKGAKGVSDKIKEIVVAADKSKDIEISGVSVSGPNVSDGVSTNGSNSGTPTAGGNGGNGYTVAADGDIYRQGERVDPSFVSMHQLVEDCSVLKEAGCEEAIKITGVYDQMDPSRMMEHNGNYLFWHEVSFLKSKEEDKIRIWIPPGTKHITILPRTGEGSVRGSAWAVSWGEPLPEGLPVNSNDKSVVDMYHSKNVEYRTKIEQGKMYVVYKNSQAQNVINNPVADSSEGGWLYLQKIYSESKLKDSKWGSAKVNEHVQMFKLDVRLAIDKQAYDEWYNSLK